MPADLEVNGIPASSVGLTDSDTATFTFATSPVPRRAADDALGRWTP